MRATWRYGVILIGAALLCLSAVRMWGGDPIPPEITPVAERAQPQHVVSGSVRDAWRSSSYAATVFVQTGVSEDPHVEPVMHDDYMFSVRRGAPTRSTWPLSVEYGEPGDTLASVSVRISPDDDLSTARWAPLANVPLTHDRGWTIAQALALDVPGDTAVIRVDVTYKDGTTTAVSRSVPAAPTLLGRMADRLGTLPGFGLLPDLR